MWNLWEIIHEHVGYLKEHFGRTNSSSKKKTICSTKSFKVVFHWGWLAIAKDRLHSFRKFGHRTSSWNDPHFEGCPTTAKHPQPFFNFYWLLCSIPEANTSISWCFLEGFRWNMEIFLGGSFATKCGDSKWPPFYPLFGGSLNLWRGHLTIQFFFFETEITNFQIFRWNPKHLRHRNKKGRVCFQTDIPISHRTYNQIYHLQNQPFHVTKATTKTICWIFNGFIFTTSL